CPLSAPAGWPIAIQRCAVAAIDRPETVARTRVVGARQLAQTAHGARARATGRDESAQFRSRVYSGNEDYAREICRTPAGGGGPPSTGRKSEQHGNDRRRVRLRERQFDAQRVPTGAKNCARPISSPLPTRETPDAKIEKQQK